MLFLCLYGLKFPQNTPNKLWHSYWNLNSINWKWKVQCVNTMKPAKRIMYIYITYAFIHTHTLCLCQSVCLSLSLWHTNMEYLLSFLLKLAVHKFYCDRHPEWRVTVRLNHSSPVLVSTLDYSYTSLLQPTNKQTLDYSGSWPNNITLIVIL